jgi:conjugative transfer region protein TrbK
MDAKIIARAAAVLLLAGTELACAVEFARLDRTSESSAPGVDNNRDLVAGELARCKVLGAEAAHDAACRVAWAQNRARFLAPATPRRQDRSIELFPTTAPSAQQPSGNAPGIDSAGR